MKTFERCWIFLGFLSGCTFSQTDDFQVWLLEQGSREIRVFDSSGGSVQSFNWINEHNTVAESLGLGNAQMIQKPSTFAFLDGVHPSLLIGDFRRGGLFVQSFWVTPMDGLLPVLRMILQRLTF